MPRIPDWNIWPFAVLILAATLGEITMQSGAFAADTTERTMTIVRIYTGTDNQSHFEDVQIPLKSTGKVGFISELVKATGIVFRETGGDYNYDFHTAPRRQYVVNLEGEVEIEVGDGTKRILRSGEMASWRTAEIILARSNV